MKNRNRNNNSFVKSRKVVETVDLTPCKSGGYCENRFEIIASKALPVKTIVCTKEGPCELHKSGEDQVKL